MEHKSVEISPHKTSLLFVDGLMMASYWQVKITYNHLLLLNGHFKYCFVIVQEFTLDLYLFYSVCPRCKKGALMI